MSKQIRKHNKHTSYKVLYSQTEIVLLFGYGFLGKQQQSRQHYNAAEDGRVDLMQEDLKACNTGYGLVPTNTCMHRISI